jgi:hypothetical protein
VLRTGELLSRLKGHEEDGAITKLVLRREAVNPAELVHSLFTSGGIRHLLIGLADRVVVAAAGEAVSSETRRI